MHPRAIPKTAEEFLDLVDQAIFELDDSLSAAEYEDDMDNQFATMASFFRDILAELRQLHAETLAGQRALGAGTDLGFWAQAQRRRKLIPFYGLLEIINTAYRNGL